MVEQALLLARVAFVVLLYLFVWRIVRLSVRDIRAPQESLVLSASAAAAAGFPAAARAARPAGHGARLVVVAGPVFPPGTLVLLEDDVLFGRDPACDVVLADDGTASVRHARVLRRDGETFLEDLDSTNGTFVDGERIFGQRLLRSGETVMIGATEFRYEVEAR